MSEGRHRAFVVACEDCAVDRRTDEPNEAVAFLRRHRRVTGHEPTFADGGVPAGWLPDAADDLPDDAGVKEVLRALEPSFEGGVPVGVLAAVMHGRGLSIADTLDRVREVRMTGGIYEPRDDHLHTF